MTFNEPAFEEGFRFVSSSCHIHLSSSKHFREVIAVDSVKSPYDTDVNVMRCVYAGDIQKKVILNLAAHAPRFAKYALTFTFERTRSVRKELNLNPGDICSSHCACIINCRA